MIDWIVWGIIYAFLIGGIIMLAANALQWVMLFRLGFRRLFARWLKRD